MKTASWLLVLFFANAASFAGAAEPLPGTQPLTWDGDIPMKMVDDLHAFADRETAASVARRARHWHRDFSSREAYEKSIEPNRARLAKYLGVDRSPFDIPKRNAFQVTFGPFDSATESPFPAAANSDPKIYTSEIRWRMRDGRTAWATYAALAESKTSAIFLTDADETPADVLGFTNALPQERLTARRLVESGCALLIPRCLSRSDEYSVLRGVERRTNQTHREFQYRQAFEMGRHPIGYDVEVVLSILDRMPRFRYEIDSYQAIFGQGEGAVTALYAAALDPRLKTVAIRGYFGPREQTSEEPIYRNVWGRLDEFGDAELASLIAPRKLIVEACVLPEVAGPPPERDGRRGAAPGLIRSPDPKAAQAERDRAKQLVRDGGWNFIELYDGDYSTTKTLNAFLNSCHPGLKAVDVRDDWKSNFPPHALLNSHWQKVQTTQSDEQLQALVRESEYVRKAWWKDADRASRDPEKWRASCAPYRRHLYDEVLGRFEQKKLPPNARTRKIYDEPTYTGYEVVLDVFSNDAEHVGVWAYGILLVPKNIPPGERRPVVVCQHGLEGRPHDTIEAGLPGERFYHQFAAKLAERGFITFSPQNPYIGKDHFRQLVRKLWPLKKTLWSFIVPQHEQITDWLASLEFVDPARIGFYGLSYGGKTAMRVPALVDRYCLSICSGDFNEWIRKITSIRDPFSYMGTHEYEIMEFDLGHTFNYAEMAGLIAPRPFMVERGHRDGVGIDEWVAYEYAKVQLLYADLKIPERTEIEYFDGPHEIHGVGTFDFLHRHLKWSAPK